MQFELSNNQRKYLGLETVKDNWERFQLTEDIYLYFDGNKIVKKITCSSKIYHECELNEETVNRKILLPKTEKGKEKKLNYTAISSVTPIGIYFVYSPNGGVSIGNYNTQTTFYSTYFEETKIDNLDELDKWIDSYIESTTENDLHELEKYKSAKRKNIKYQEGDFFRFKVDRRNYGFGRILLDISKLRRQEFFKLKPNHGLANLMGKAIVVKIYHKISQGNEIDLSELKQLKACPSQYLMDNRVFYGEFDIIGNLKLDENELDFPISYSKSINYKDADAIYIQWGLIYLGSKISKFNKYLKGTNPFVDINNPNYLIDNPYREESTGFSLDIQKDILQDCIIKDSNTPFWEKDEYNSRFDLRNPINFEIKNEIFQHFGLNPNLEYYQNLDKILKRN